MATCKLLESGYHFTETDIESRFQQLHASLKNNMANVSALELDNAIYENEQIQEGNRCIVSHLYS